MRSPARPTIAHRLLEEERRSGITVHPRSETVLSEILASIVAAPRHVTSRGSPASVRRCLAMLSQRMVATGFTSCPFGLFADGLLVRSLDPFCWCVLGIAAGRTCGLPLQLVRVPGHVFTRWCDGRGRCLNWEPFRKPHFRPDSWYRTVYRIATSRHRARYLADVDDRHFRALVRLRLAEYWRMRGDLSRRRRLVESAVRNAPDYPECWHAMASVESAAGATAAALRCLAKAVHRDPRDAVLWHELGVLFGTAGRHAHALECFERALRCDPHRRDTLMYREATRQLLRPRNGRRAHGNGGRSGRRMH